MAVEIVLSVIGYISLISPVAGILLGYSKPPAFLWYYLVFMFGADIIFRLLKIYDFGLHKHIFLNIYTLLNFCFLWYYFSQKILKKQIWLKYTSLIIFVMAVILIIRNDFSQFNGISAAILSFVYMLFCIVTLYSMFSNEEIIILTKSPLFFFTIGILIYNATVFFLLGLTNFYLKKENLTALRNVWVLNDIANIVHCLLFYKALTLKKEKYSLQNTG